MSLTDQDRQEVREEIFQVFLEVCQEINNSENCPEPFTKPLDLEILRGKLTDKMFSIFKRLIDIEECKEGK